jgi:hypothetical protein
MGGLWPAELLTVTAQTAPLVKYLKADLQRIVDSANDELTGIRRAGMAEPIRQAEEARVINGARAFAARRVESTVRHLRRVTEGFPAEHRPMNGASEPERIPRFRIATPAQPEMDAPTGDSEDSAPPSAEVLEQGSEPVPTVDQDDNHAEPVDAVVPVCPAVEPETVGLTMSAPTYLSDSDDTEVLEDITTVFAELGTLAESVAEPVAEPVADDAAEQPSTGRHAAPAADEAVTTCLSSPLTEPESDQERLERFLKFVAQQEPGLRWAVGDREDGTTVLATDLAHGWIPPGILLPDGVRLMEPERRTGNAAALLGQTVLSVTYSPGDPLGWATAHDVSDASSQPRELPLVDDLGWVLSEATHWRDGLPRMVHTLAKAGAAGTGVVEAEIDLLRVYLDTARYQLLARYPDVDTELLLNCLLLAATEGIASGNSVIANYHFTWFQMLSAPPASRWKASL